MIPVFPIPPRLSLDESAALLKSAYGLEGEVTQLKGERDFNLLVTLTDGSQWVFKIASAEEDPQHLDMQVTALRHLEETAPDLPLPRVRASLDGQDLQPVTLADGTQCLARLVSFLPAKSYGDVERSLKLDQAVGAFIARLDQGLVGLFHPGGRAEMIWDVQLFARLRPLLDSIPKASDRRLVEGVLDRAGAGILKSLKQHRAQLIHNDATLDNTLADPEAGRIAGVIDFGDMMYQPLVVEPAIAAADLMRHANDPLGTLRAIALGFDSVTRLTDGEVAVFADLVAMRTASGLLILHAGLFGPTSQEMLEAEIATLDCLETAGTEQITRDLQRALHVPRGEAGLFQRRRQVTLPGYEHFYAEPLHLVKGRGAVVTDLQGREYIDAYNNVPHVGHCHPRVVNAQQRQAERLNINTRYLFDSLAAYAERLVATLPAGLDRCLLVSSGSEANDVAWRMAWAATGKQGALATDGAYHGVTDLVARLSPSGLVRDDPDPPYLRRIHAPYPLRHPERDLAAETLRALESIDDAIASLQESGQGVAALMLDTGLTSNGVQPLPPGYLAAAVEKTHAAGGLFIADEVQPGFGRCGESFWRFEQDGVVPDIVTMGKAVGNGFPLAVTVTTQEIAQAFSDKFYFFSSMGGNPVACAVGLAVLDCLEDEGLQANARVIGQRLTAGLQQLAQRHPEIAEVRGQGLLLGVELHQDGQPSAALVEAVSEGMRERGVLVGREGMDGSIVKIRPPMVVNAAQADRIVQAFGESLSAAVQAG
ncbi:MAG: aminotransferase class III-fold pyridoxal phosphate-dependent enzyme [Pseudomonadota bacterium]